ncbi:hypothetical protein B0H16DRAFT_218615 [Mycena metata]|uniref:Uncharacterized protein n=1 Tax=Mycena metata TaxID=1033252 RepID=A0AAD7JSD8_9AGAR|nr:hypothetical protein B0H16DRAFT_218615 [Mycena metata]
MSLWVYIYIYMCRPFEYNCDLGFYYKLYMNTSCKFSLRPWELMRTFRSFRLEPPKRPASAPRMSTLATERTRIANLNDHQTVSCAYIHPGMHSQDIHTVTQNSTYIPHILTYFACFFLSASFLSLLAPFPWHVLAFVSPFTCTHIFPHLRPYFDHAFIRVSSCHLHFSCLATPPHATPSSCYASLIEIYYYIRIMLYIMHIRRLPTDQPPIGGHEFRVILRLAGWRSRGESLREGEKHDSCIVRLGRELCEVGVLFGARRSIAPTLVNSQ